MSIEFNDQQLESAENTPLRAIDPTTNRAYVLVSAEEFERLQGILGDDVIRSMERHLADLAPEDWEDASNYESSP